MYLGIDFGTSTNYIVRVDLEGNSIVPVENIGEFGEGEVIDNAIYYGESEVVLGKAAIKRKGSDPKNLIRYIKLKMGNEDDKIFIPRKKREVSPIEIASDIFKKIKERIEELAGSESIEGVVITVPFDYRHQERKAIKKAGELAGLKVLGLIEEPLAASISSNLEKANDGIEIIFDLGGGTLDITVAKVQKDNENIVIETLNTEGSKNIGGRHIDKAIFDYIYENEIKREIGTIDKNELLEQIRKEKERLSDDEAEGIFCELKSGETIDVEITEEIVRDVLKKNGFIDELISILMSSIEDVNIKKEMVNKFIFVGGATKLNIIKDEIEKIFGESIDYINYKEQELVGLGAGHYLMDLIGKKSIYKVIPKVNHSIGIDEKGRNEKIIEKNFEYNKESKLKEYKIENIEKVITLDVYQGESSVSKDCVKVGKISIDTSKTWGKIGITLLVDKNGIIKYKIYDLNGEKRLVDENEID